MVETRRSDEDIITQAPIKLKFGAKEYDVQLLRIKAARVWRKNLVDQVSDIAGVMKSEAINTSVFLNGLGFLFLQFPEKLADLVFAYGVDLPRDTVEDEATEEQLALAFGKIVQVAFPFTQELQTISHTMGLAAQLQPLAKSTK